MKGYLGTKSGPGRKRVKRPALTYDEKESKNEAIFEYIRCVVY